MAVIDQSVVRIGPDFKGFKAALEGGLKTASAGVTVKVRVIPDLYTKKAQALFRREAMAELKKIDQLTVKVKLVADGGGISGGSRSLKQQAEQAAAKSSSPRRTGDSDAVKEIKAQARELVQAKKAASQAAAQTTKDRAKVDADAAREVESVAKENKRARKEALRAQGVLHSEALSMDRTFNQQAAKLERDRVAAQKAAASEAVAAQKQSDRERVASERAAANELKAVTQQNVAARRAANREQAQIHAEALTDDRAFNQAATRTERDRLRGVKDAAREAAKVDREATSALKKAEAERDKVTREAAQKRKDLAGQFVNAPKLIDLGGEGLRPMSALYASLVVLAPVLIAIASSAIQAGTSLVALGSAAYGGGLAVAGLTAAFAGVLGALKLHSALLKAQQGQSAKAAKADITNAGTIRNAYNSVRSAKEGVLDASRSLKDAQVAEKRAVADVAKAYQDAAQKVKDLRLQLADLQVQRSGNKLDVAEAKRHQREIESDFFATNLMKQQAAQSTLEAEQRGRDIASELGKTKTDLAERVRTGVGGTPEVINARDAASKATAARQNAERGLAASIRGVAEAQRNYADALKTSNAATSGALAQDGQLKAALKDLSPAARSLYGWLVDNTEQFKKYKRSIEQAILPGFLDFLKDVTARGKGSKSTVDTLVDGITGIGRQISRTVTNMGQLAKSKWFKGELVKLNKDNEKAFGNVGDAAVTLITPITRLFVAASPLIVRFTDYIKTVADKFAAWVGSFSDRDLLGWFSRAGDEMAKWWKIATDLGSFLVSIFTASLPTGNNLVSRLGDLTGKLALWAKSDSGQAQIRSFFDFFKQINYGDLVKVVVAITALLGAWKLGAIAGKSPFYTFIGLLATQWPDTAATVMERVATSAVKLLGWMDQHPGQAATLLLIISGLKGLNKIKPLGDIFGKIPGMDKVLSIFGDRGSTPTNPLFVSDIARGLGGAPGGPSVPGIPGEPGKPGKPAGEGVPRRNVKTPGGGLGEFVFAPLPDYITNNPQAKSLVKELEAARKAYPGGKLPANWRPGMRPAAPTSGNENPNVAGGGAETQGPGVWNPGADIQARQDEANAFKAFNDKIRDHTIAIAQDSAASANSSRTLQDYVARRKEAVNQTLIMIRATKGNAAAEAQASAETQGSISTLSSMMQQMGWTKDAADAYATSAFSVAKKTDKGTTSFHGFGKQVEVTRGQISDLNTHMGALKESTDKVTGKKVITLEVNGEKKVFDTIKDAVVYQAALKTGNTSPTELANQKRIYDKLSLLADGGHIRGAGTATSDSILARLSDGEYVQPTKAVKHYGTDFMEAVRTRQLPKFAKGGLTGGGTWPMSIDLSETLIPQSPLLGGGVVSGDAKVAAIAEATARAMGASEKQLIALVEAGLVESGMRNLSYGDRDSVGFLQQRAGWGSTGQRMDPAYATRKFIAKAMKVDKKRYDAGQLAQAVQVSAFPDRYQQRYADAIAILNQAAPYVSGGGGFLGGQAGGRGWQWQVAALAKAGYVFHPTRGQTTGGGHAKDSWHYKGRAVDLSPPSMGVFDAIKSRWGGSTLELIYGPAVTGIKNGRPYNYGKTLNAEHMNHVHWAYRDGGLVQKFDRGGILQPGATVAVNTTRKPETVRTYEQEKALQSGSMRIDRRDLALLASYIVSAVANQRIDMDGRKVAETVRGYDVLPRGI